MEKDTVVVSLADYNALRDYKKAHMGKMTRVDKLLDGKISTTYVEKNEITKGLFEAITLVDKQVIDLKAHQQLERARFESKINDLNIELKRANCKIADYELEYKNFIKDMYNYSLLRFWNWKRSHAIYKSL